MPVPKLLHAAHMTPPFQEFEPILYHFVQLGMSRSHLIFGNTGNNFFSIYLIFGRVLSGSKSRDPAELNEILQYPLSERLSKAKVTGA